MDGEHRVQRVRFGHRGAEQIANEKVRILHLSRVHNDQDSVQSVRRSHASHHLLLDRTSRVVRVHASQLRLASVRHANRDDVLFSQSPSNIQSEPRSLIPPHLRVFAQSQVFRHLRDRRRSHVRVGHVRLSARRLPPARPHVS